MRIISKFQDYYDSSLGFGADPNLVYVRKTDEYARELPFEFKEQYNDLSETRCYPPNYEHFTIGFCGKIIPIFKTIKNNSYPYSNETKEVFFYGDDALEELYNFLGKNSKLKNNWRMRRELEKIKANKALKLEKIFIDFNVPIFLIGGNRNYINKQGYKEYSTGLTLNPCLKNYKFFTQYDAYQAFQEISMFIGGVLPRKEPDTVDISDACRSYQKGFDSWSFRKSGPNSKKKAKTTKGDKCQ